MGELAQRVGAAGVDPDVLRDRRGDGALQQRRRGAQTVGEGHHHGPAQRSSREVAERDRGVDRPGRAGTRFDMGRVVRRAGVPAGAPAGGHQDDRALRLAGREHAGQLQQDRGPRQLRQRAPPGGVAMGEDHDRRRPGRAGAFGEHRRERASAVDRLGAGVADGDRKAPGGRVAELPQGPHHVGRQFLVAQTPGATVRVARGQGPQVGERARAVEGVGRQIRGERPGTVAQGESDDRQDDRQRDERRAIDASVEHVESLPPSGPATDAAPRSRVAAPTSSPRGGPGRPALSYILRACSSRSPWETRRSPTTRTSAARD